MRTTVEVLWVFTALLRRADTLLELGPLQILVHSVGISRTNEALTALSGRPANKRRMACHASIQRSAVRFDSTRLRQRSYAKYVGRPQLAL